MQASTPKKKEEKQKLRLSDMAYEKLKREIITAQMEPGSPINEQEAMEVIGVGRTPLREALQRLVQEDLVLSVPQRGYFVSSTSASDFYQLQEFRTECEIMAVSLAAQRITDAQLAELKALIDEATAGVEDGNKTTDWHLNIDEQLHMLIAKASGNAFLERTLRRLFALSLRSFYVSGVAVTLLDDELNVYHELYNALESKNAQKAVQAMVSHLELTNIEKSRSQATRGYDASQRGSY